MSRKTIEGVYGVMSLEKFERTFDVTQAAKDLACASLGWFNRDERITRPVDLSGFRKDIGGQALVAVTSDEVYPKRAA